MKSRWLLLVALAAIGAAAYGGNVLATPASTPGFSGTTLAKATFGDLDIKAHTIPADVWKAELKTKGDSDLYVQQNTWDPSLCTQGPSGSCGPCPPEPGKPCIPSSGWHTHPGPSLVIVTQGTVTEYEGDDPTCTPHVYSARRDERVRRRRQRGRTHHPRRERRRGEDGRRPAHPEGRHSTDRRDPSSGQLPVLRLTRLEGGTAALQPAHCEAVAQRLPVGADRRPTARGATAP